MLDSSIQGCELHSVFGNKVSEIVRGMFVRGIKRRETGGVKREMCTFPPSSISTGSTIPLTIIPLTQMQRHGFHESTRIGITARSRTLSSCVPPRTTGRNLKGFGYMPKGRKADFTGLTRIAQVISPGQNKIVRGMCGQGN
jgi:hypothetical protein